MSAAAVELETALKLLSLPRDVGPHPESGDMIQAGLGRYGPYLKYQGSFTSLKDQDDLLEIGLNRAVDLLADRQRSAGALLANIRMAAKFTSRQAVSDPMSNITSFVPPCPAAPT